MQPLDDVLGRGAHGGDEDLRAAVDDGVDQLVQFAPRVIHVGLARRAPDLREEEIDAERQVGIVEVSFELRDHFLELRGCVANSADHSEPAGVGDRCGERCTGGLTHAGEHDGVADAELTGKLCLD